MKVNVEWQDGQVWRSVLVVVAVSRNNNYTFKHDGKVYVFKNQKEGEQVLVLEGAKWVNAGRVTRNYIFLGEGTSSDEYYQTPEGIKQAREALQSFLADRRRGK